MSLDWLTRDRARAYLVLDARVFTLRVLPDENGVDILVGGLESPDGSAGTDVGEKVKGPAECQVQGNVALANCSGR